MGKMETELKEWFDQYRYDNLKRIGLAGTMKASGKPSKMISIRRSMKLNSYSMRLLHRMVMTELKILSLPLPDPSIMGLFDSL